MATIREVILPNQKREDGTWNVKIRVTHQRKVNYISTQHYVGAKQIRPDHSIKDPIILNAIYPTLKEYREKISELGGCFGHMLHPVPWQTDHLFCWQRNAAHALAA